MNRSSEAWSDFDHAQRSVAALKEELLKTEVKLQNAAKTFTWDKEEGLAFRSTNVKPSLTCNRSLHRQQFRLHPSLSVSHANGETDGVPSKEGNEFAYQPLSEDRPRLRRRRPTRKNPEEIKRKVIHAALTKTLLRISSDDSSSSSANGFNLPGSSTVPRTFSFNVKTHPSEIKSAESEKVGFSKWEQEFLRKEVPELDISTGQTSTASGLSSIEDRCSSKKKIASQIEPLSQNVSEVFKKIQNLVSRQKSELAATDTDDDSFLFRPNLEKVNVALQTESQPSVPVIKFPSTQKVPQNDNLDSPEKLIPPIRKTSVVPPPTTYRGFSSVSQAQKSPKKKPIVNPEFAKVLSPVAKQNQVRKTCMVKEKNYITPFSWREAQKFADKQLGPPAVSPRKTENKENANDSDKNEDDEISDINLDKREIKSVVDENTQQNDVIDLTDSPEKKENETENQIDCPHHYNVTDVHLEAAKKILEELNPELDTSTETEKEDNPIVTEIPKRQLQTVKRNAAKTQEFHPPLPKIRHYDREAVKKYMEKQRVQRKKKILDEQERKIQFEKMKTERLFQLYEYQKQAAKSKLVLNPTSSPKGVTGVLKAVQRVNVSEDGTISLNKSPKKIPNENDVNELDSVESRTESPKLVGSLKKQSEFTSAYQGQKGAENECSAKNTGSENPPISAKVSVKTQTSFHVPCVEKENQEPFRRFSNSPEKHIHTKSPNKKLKNSSESCEALSLNDVTNWNLISSVSSLGSSREISSMDDDSTLDSISVKSLDFLPSKMDSKLNNLALSIMKQADIGIQQLEAFIQQKQNKTVEPQISDSQPVEDMVDLIEGSLDSPETSAEEGEENDEDLQNAATAILLKPNEECAKDVPFAESSRHAPEAFTFIPMETLPVTESLPWSSMKFNLKPDPHNVINTWNRKPLWNFLSQEASRKDSCMPLNEDSLPSYTHEPITHATDEIYTSDFSSMKELKKADILQKSDDVLKKSNDASPMSEAESTLSNISELLSNGVKSAVNSEDSRRADYVSLQLETIDVLDASVDIESGKHSFIVNIQTESHSEIASVTTENENGAETLANTSEKIKTSLDDNEISSIAKDGSPENSEFIEELVNDTDGSSSLGISSFQSDKNMNDEQSSIDKEQSDKPADDNERFHLFNSENVIKPSITINPVTSVFDPSTLTRVATEAAAAAATSAVIAVFENQKALNLKSLDIAGQHISSQQGYSSDFENSTGSQNQSSNSRQASVLEIGSSKNSLVEELCSAASLSQKSSTTLSVQDSHNSLLEESILSDIREGHFDLKVQASTSRESISDSSVATKKLKGLDNISSPSPAGLSDEGSSPSTLFSSNGSLGTHHRYDEDFVQGDQPDSFAQFTVDMVQRMAEEEELRAHHQLSLLECQEKSLIEKVRAKLKTLEKLKRQMEVKNETSEVSYIKKQQYELILMLRQERAQIRCMQETYRSIGRKKENSFPVKSKYSTEVSRLKPKSMRKHGSAPQLPSTVDIVSVSLYVPSVVTEEENNTIEEEVKSQADIPEIVQSSSSSLESQVRAISKSSQFSLSAQDNSVQNTLSKSTKSDVIVSQLSQPTSHSVDGAVQGIKRLEANRRYLTKREQRLVQRRNQAESLLQWQKQLDSEEKKVRELEQKAIEIVEKSKSKTKHYASSPSASQINNETDVGTDTKTKLYLNSSSEVQDESKLVSSLKTESELKDSDSVPEEDIHASLSAKSDVEDILHLKVPDSKNSSSTSVVEENLRATSSSVSEQMSASSKHNSQTFQEITSSKTTSSVQSLEKSESNSEVYSESFESTGETPKTSSPLQIMNFTSPDGSKKQIGSRRLPLGARYRRHDSSGSDDSFTISHSETASDQSDIEGRICALTEEIKRRKTEAGKLEKEQKRHRGEILKEKEFSLRKQLEGYNKYIKDATAELEEQVENARHQNYTPIVKPQIKHPRVAKSRQLQKQSIGSNSSESFSDRKDDESMDRESVEIKNVSSESQERKVQSSHLAKKMRAIEIKESSEEVATDISYSNEDAMSQKPSKSEKVSISDATVQEELPVSGGDSSKRTSENSSGVSDSNQTYSQETGFGEFSHHSTKDSNDNKDAATVSDVQHDSGSNKPSEESSIEDLIEGPLDESEDSNLSNRTFHEKTDRSTDGGSFESYSTVEEEEMRDSIESKEPCSGSGGCFTPPPEQLSVGILEDRDSRDEVVNKLLAMESKGAEIKIETSDKLQKKSTSVYHSQLEAFVDEMIEEVVKSYFENTENSEFQDIIGRNVQLNLNDDQLVQKPVISTSNLRTSLTSIHEKAAYAVSEKVIESLLQDAIFTVIALLREHYGFERALSICTIETETKHDVCSSGDEMSIIEKILGNTKQNVDLTPSTLSFAGFGIVSSLEDKCNEKVPLKSAAKTHDVAVHQNQSDEEKGDANQLQLLDQQRFVQQYPHFYRQIPNKPPPPYTPPASPLVFNKQQRNEVDQQKRAANAVQDVLDKLESIVEDNISVLLEGKEQHISLEDVKMPIEFLELDNVDQMTKNQRIFKNFLFELTRETVMMLYVEKEEKFKPWLRNQRLRRKPVLPKDKSEALKPVLQEVKRLIHPLPPFPSKDQSTWSAMKLGRKKRDFVDTIIISELKEEEPDWVNYDQDEFMVKMQMTDSIFKVLVEDTTDVCETLNIDNRKFKSKI